MQQGDLFTKQNQLFSVVDMGSLSLLTVDLDVETSLAVPNLMVKKLVNDALDHLAGNLKTRAEHCRRNRSISGISCRAAHSVEQARTQWTTR